MLESRLKLPWAYVTSIGRVSKVNFVGIEDEAVRYSFLAKLRIPDLFNFLYIP